MAETKPADFRTGAVFIETPINLRAGDALHLAVTHRLGAQIASLNKRMCDAAKVLGLARHDF